MFPVSFILSGLVHLLANAQNRWTCISKRVGFAVMTLLFAGGFTFVALVFGKAAIGLFFVCLIVLCAFEFASRIRDSAESDSGPFSLSPPETPEIEEGILRPFPVILGGNMSILLANAIGEVLQ